MENVEYLDNGCVDPIVDTRMDKLPPLALLAVGRTMKEGMKYDEERPDNWRGIPPASHLNHALRHVAMWQSGDRSEDHVAHAMTRMLMWGELVQCSQ